MNLLLDLIITWAVFGLVITVLAGLAIHLLAQRHAAWWRKHIVDRDPYDDQ